MKAKAVLLMLAIMCVLGTTCFAARIPKNQNSVPLPHERMALGGIHVGDTMDIVKSTLGVPDSQDLGYSQMSESNVATWKYGASVTIHFFESKGEYYVQIVNVDADNGFATPDGIKVGMDENALRRAYGEPEVYLSSKNGEGQYRYRNDRHSMIEFVFQVKDGKITHIGLGFND